MDTNNEGECSKHPCAPHGFNRNASHSEDRYVCDCEGWSPDRSCAGLELLEALKLARAELAGLPHSLGYDFTLDYELQSMAANAIAHAANMVQASWQEAAGYYTLPHVVHRPKLSKDGNQWCALLGDNIQEGLCAFGDTPAKAMHAFDLAWERP